MGFIDSYKQLEKLCGEIFNDERKLSAYIDEMKNTPRGPSLVNDWDNDLKKLKHYRWLRNKIVHEPECSEENMCEPGDAEWLDNFYTRIMNRTDPLTLYRKANIQKTQYVPKDIADDNQKFDDSDNTEISQKKLIGCATIAFIVAFVFLIICILNILNRI